MDLAALLDQAFDDDGPLATTFAVVVVKGGRLVAERYHGALEHFDRAPTPVTAGTPLLSWSMAKSMLHAVVGLLVGDGRLDLDAPADVPEWSDPGDPRHAITLRQLLAMRDGLDFVEDYVDDRVSDVIQMLFGEGQPDMAHFAADRPLAAPPGRASTTRRAPRTSSRASSPAPSAAARTTPASCTAASSVPVGMASADPEFDEAGTWVASSYLRATARDWRPLRAALPARRRRGTASASSRPAGSTTPAPWVSEDPEDASPYGAHWWGVAERHARHLPRLGLRGPVRSPSAPPSTSSWCAWARRRSSASRTSPPGAWPWCRPSPAPR